MVVEGCVSRSVLDTALWLDVVSGGSKEAEAPAAARQALRRVGRRTRRASCGSASRPCAPRALAPPTVSDEVKQTVAEAADLLATLGHEVTPARSRLGPDRRHDHRPLPQGVAETVDEVPLPERLERRTRGFGRLGGLLPESLYEKAMRQPPGRDRPHQRDLRRRRRAGDAGDGRHGAAGPPLAGPRRPPTRCSG